MVYLCDIMDLDLLDEMIEQGYVTARPHKDSSLVILNYTPKAQYDWKWNDVTVACRGLIYETDESGARGRVIARPFEKFFNWDQGVGNETWQNKMPPTGPVVRMEKMDGSLGILYPIYAHKFNGGNDGWFVVDHAIATRGSFHSEQAEWATTFYREVMDNWEMELAGKVGQGVSFQELFMPHPYKTYLFEIIYPENRIVVDYGEYKGLVLIDVIDNETGFADLQEFDDCNWPDKVSRTVLNHGFDSGQAAEIPPGDEGFVYLWPNINFRTKMKSADYIELHRLVSNLSQKSVWEQMVAGKTKAQIKDGLPDEFHGFVDETFDNIEKSAVDLMSEAYREYERIHNDQQSRKEFAQLASKSPMKKFLFMILDERPVYPVALAAAKPKADKPLISEEEA